MSYLYWIAGSAMAYFLLSGKKAAPWVPPTLRRDPYIGKENTYEYNEEIAADPELRVPPTERQMFGSWAFFNEAKWRKSPMITWPPDGSSDIMPIYQKSLSDGTVRLVGDLMPSGDYYPKGSAQPLNLWEIDPQWQWR